MWPIFSREYFEISPPLVFQMLYLLQYSQTDLQNIIDRINRRQIYRIDYM